MIMNFKKYNNLIDLFFEQCEKQPSDKIFLTSLKDPNKNFSWREVKLKVLNLAKRNFKYNSKR